MSGSGDAVKSKDAVKFLLTDSVKGLSHTVVFIPILQNKPIKISLCVSPNTQTGFRRGVFIVILHEKDGENYSTMVKVRGNDKVS